MHGRKRETPEQSRERKAASAPKAALYAQLQAAVLAKRGVAAVDAEALALSARLLELNPEVLTAWSLRRDALAHLQSEEGGEQRAAELFAEELRLGERCLRRNPKSYGAWHHRRWVLRELCRRSVAAPAEAQAVLARELLLTQQLLQADERNFHCWGFRRYVAGLAGESAEVELAFTRSKIDSNFSNYSAWHHRASLLRLAAPQAEAPPAGGPEAASGLAARAQGPLFAPAPQPSRRLGVSELRAEFEYASQAFWTEPEDEAAWCYQGWLVQEALQGAAAGALGWAEASELLRDAARVCRELADAEPACRWPRLTLVSLLRSLAECRREEGAGAGEDGWRQEARELLQALQETDPMRRGQYADMLADLSDTSGTPC